MCILYLWTVEVYVVDGGFCWERGVPARVCGGAAAVGFVIGVDVSMQEQVRGVMSVEWVAYSVPD